MKNKLTSDDIFNAMEKWASRELSLDWDNAGLQVGSYSKTVKNIMITLDVLESVVDEAIEKGIDLIIAHHPLLFKSAKQINTDEVQGRIIQKLLKHDITVYASHTNLDAAIGGVNDMLCEAIGINNAEILMDSYTEALYKLVVYVPATHVNDVRNALGEMGAGHIGNYSHCTFQSAGTGTFKPLTGTNPYLGKEGNIEHVDEMKLETIVKEKDLTAVLLEMKRVHPYEEVAYDIYTLKEQGVKYGFGRIGDLAESMTLEDLCDHIKKCLDVPAVRVTGALDQKVRKIAVLGGSGADYVHVARGKGAEVYITGDMSFHHAQDAWQMGLNIIDPGHHVEKVMKEATKNYLESVFTPSQVNIIISDSNTEPFQFV